MESAEHHVRAAGAVVVGEGVGTVGGGDVDLDAHEFRVVVEIEFLHVLVLE